MFCCCAGISWEGQIQLAAFCVFEFCVGLFWPSMMKMRAQHVPEEMRATIINFFRIPLNAFVCIVLYNVRALLCTVPDIFSHAPPLRELFRSLEALHNIEVLPLQGAHSYRAQMLALNFLLPQCVFGTWA